MNECALYMNVAILSQIKTDDEKYECDDQHDKMMIGII
jgi:hypothetical protein